jgi:TatD DNase family protein
MIELADSHAHLDMPEFKPDRAEVVSRAWKAGVRSLLCPADVTDADSVARTLKLTGEFAWISAAAGVHPHQAKALAPVHFETIETLAGERRIVAVGEVGLDYHYDFSPPERQREAFRAQVELAEKLALPLIIHSRQAGADVIAAIAETGFTQGGVLHCFTEDWETARRMLDRGFYISFSGILTYPSAGNLRAVATRIPEHRLLVETDSPYLVPAPHRGKAVRNEPAFVLETARHLAALRRAPLDELAPRMLQNFRELFPGSHSQA